MHSARSPSTVANRLDHPLLFTLFRFVQPFFFYLSNPLVRLSAFSRLLLGVVKRVGGRKLHSADAHLRSISGDLFSASIVVWYFVSRIDVPTTMCLRETRRHLLFFSINRLVTQLVEFTRLASDLCRCCLTQLLFFAAVLICDFLLS